MQFLDTSQQVFVVSRYFQMAKKKIIERLNKKKHLRKQKIEMQNHFLQLFKFLNF